MPRRSRLAIAHIPWHIIQRGNNRTSCFYADDDYRYFLQTLQEQAEKYHCAIHAYVLMTNHVHLLLTPSKPNSPSLLMKHLGQRYVQYINKTYRRSGTLWEGRFRSCLIQEENYFLTCSRYVELNPVRAGLVFDPADYPWSSYRVNALGEDSPLVKPHMLYQRLGQWQGERQAVYRALFEAPLEDSVIEEIRRLTNGNYALGDNRFKEEMEIMLQRRARPARAGRPRNEEKNDHVKTF